MPYIVKLRHFAECPCMYMLLISFYIIVLYIVTYLVHFVDTRIITSKGIHLVIVI